MFKQGRVEQERARLVEAAKQVQVCRQKRVAWKNGCRRMMRRCVATVSAGDGPLIAHLITDGMRYANRAIFLDVFWEGTDATLVFGRFYSGRKETDMHRTHVGEGTIETLRSVLYAMVDRAYFPLNTAEALAKFVTANGEFTAWHVLDQFVDQKVEVEEDEDEEDEEGPPPWTLHEEGADECPLCLDAHTNCITTCGHEFCTSCIGEWRKVGAEAVCPLCRTDLSSSEQIVS
jgi:hypothetical protein